MVIDFDKIVEEHIQGFKGGEGRLDTRSYVDDKTRIMYSTLRPGARSGEHIHKGTFGAEETVRVGHIHYCPEGHKHWFENRTKHNVVFLAVVPTLG